MASVTSAEHVVMHRGQLSLGHMPSLVRANTHAQHYFAATVQHHTHLLPRASRVR